MSSIGGDTSPVLVYRRIAHNRLQTWLLVAMSVVTLAPFVFGISFLASAGIVSRVRSKTRNQASTVHFEERMLERFSDGTRTEWTQAYERDLEVRRAALAKLKAEDQALLFRLIPVFSLALIAILGLVFWGIASSPTSKLLGQVGARPAGEGEQEARRLLENLAIGAGLPAPKLYIIESSVPNAFAAGMDPANAVVAITSGALKLFDDKRELEGVLAHELSHIGNHDIRLNTTVAAIALFLRIPYLMFKGAMESKSMYYNDHHHAQRKRSLLFRMALCPIAIYILFIAPVLAALIRSAVSRQREFLADADAALLTRYPEGLMRALAKIGGAGSGVAGANPAFAHFYFADPSAKASLFSGNLLATHPPITERIERLVQFQGPSAVAGLEDAVRHGKKYSQNLGSIAAAERDLNPGVRDELSALNQGNVMGRVYRVLSQSPVPIYDLSNTTSCRVAMVKPGSLLVVFDDPGKMRQVNTADQTFGYMERSVKLVPVNNMIPAEVYDPKLRAAAEAALPPLSDAPSAASLATGGLTRSQLYLALGFGGAVFAGMLILLVAFGGK